MSLIERSSTSHVQALNFYQAVVECQVLSNPSKNKVSLKSKAWLNWLQSSFMLSLIISTVSTLSCWPGSGAQCRGLCRCPCDSPRWSSRLCPVMIMIDNSDDSDDDVTDLSRVALIRLVRALGADSLCGLPVMIVMWWWWLWWSSSWHVPGVGVVPALLRPRRQLGRQLDSLTAGGQGRRTEGLVVEVREALRLLPPDGEHLEPLARREAGVLGGAPHLGLSRGLARLEWWNEQE